MYEGHRRTKTLDYYLELPYPIQLTKEVQDGEEYWVAEILDLPGCMAHGSTPDEAIESVEDAKRAWVESQLEDRQKVPEPSDTRGYSGKLLLRLPKSVHRKLAREAQRESVSLNQLIVSRLSGQVSPGVLERDLGQQVEELSRAVEAVLAQLYLAHPVPGSLLDRVDIGQVLGVSNAVSDEDAYADCHLMAHYMGQRLAWPWVRMHGYLDAESKEQTWAFQPFNAVRIMSSPQRASTRVPERAR